VRSRRATATLAALALLAAVGCAESGAPSMTTDRAGGDATAPAPPRPLAGRGIRAALPASWDGAIRGAGGRAILHAASFPLGSTAGDDLAGAAVARIPADGVLIALVEMGKDALGSVLYSSEGVPEIAPVQIAPRVASGPIPDRAGGVQRFFTAAGRPFMLYVAVGSLADAEPLVAEANRVLATLEISAR
jgi:hypothetical protein